MTHQPMIMRRWALKYCLALRRALRSSAYADLKSRPHVVAALLLVMLQSVATAALALEPNRAITQYAHDVWTEADDLPLGSVTGIVQSREGYLWLATQDGLVRFDGVRFEVLTPADTPKMGKRSVAGLVMDQQGALWMTLHGGGVARKNGGEWTAFGAKDGLPTESAETLLADRLGRIWVSTSRGVRVLERGKFAASTFPHEFRDTRADPLLEDRQGNLWFGTRNGLYRWRNGALTHYGMAEGLPHNAVLSAYEDAKGRLWFGTRNGLVEMRAGRFIVHPIPGGPTRQIITVINGDREGNLWLGSAGGGLLRFREGRIDALGPEEGISHVTSIYIDAENSLWIGTFGDGLHRLQRGKFIVYGVKEGLSHDATYSATEDAEGAVWIGTYGGGLNRLKDGVVTTYTAADGLRNENLGAVVSSRNGDIWIGTLSGLHRLADGKIRAYTKADGIEERLVTAMLLSSSGQLWIGNDEGLHVLQDGRFRVYTERDGLPSDAVSALADGRDGALWIGTYDGGLTRWKNGRFTTYRDAGLSEQPIACLYEDAQGALWVGTFGGGLVRVYRGRFDVYTTRQGMFDDQLLNILEDDAGRLWMSSNRGIFSVDKRDFDLVASGALPALRTAVYGKGDGMRTIETNGGGLAAKHRDGRLWFPTQKGVVVVDPKRLSINTRPPPVVIEDLRANNRVIDLRSAIELGPGTTNLEIQYTGLSLVDPKKITFRYRLQGYDKEWVEAGVRRVAYYTNLEPGDYKFQVIARNSDGIWNEAGSEISFSIRPHFYQTMWFSLLCASAVLFGIWALHRIRLTLAMAKTAVFEERNRIAQEIHDGLTQELGGISMQLEAARDRVETAKTMEEAVESIGYVQRARAIVEGALEEMHRLIWALHPARLEDTDLPEAVGHLIAELEADGATGFVYRVEGTPVELSREVELATLRIAQEALFNATRHGRANRIEVSLSYEPKTLRLTVKDDGCGFDSRLSPMERRGRFGLSGMEERVRRLRGTLRLESEVGAGTTVIATFSRRGHYLRMLIASIAWVIPKSRAK